MAPSSTAAIHSRYCRRYRRETRRSRRGHHITSSCHAGARLSTRSTYNADSADVITESCIATAGAPLSPRYPFDTRSVTYTCWRRSNPAHLAGSYAYGDAGVDVNDGLRGLTCAAERSRTHRQYTASEHRGFSSPDSTSRAPPIRKVPGTRRASAPMRRPIWARPSHFHFSAFASGREQPAEDRALSPSQHAAPTPRFQRPRR